MALVKDTNSYVTITEANSYFEDRIDVAAWTSANDSEKSKALVTATSYLDQMNWIGSVVSETQTLAFPRNGYYFDPRLGMNISLPNILPLRIFQATCELAYHFLNNDGLLDDTGFVKDLNVGSISLTDIRPAEKLPAIVKRFIKPLLVNQGASLWWRAN